MATFFHCSALSFSFCVIFSCPSFALTYLYLLKVLHCPFGVNSGRLTWVGHVQPRQDGCQFWFFLTCAQMFMRRLHMTPVVVVVVLVDVLGYRLTYLLGTSLDQCRSMVQYIFTSTETRRLVRTDSPGRPPRLSHSSWTMRT